MTARCSLATRAACCNLRKQPGIAWRRRGCQAGCVSAWSRRSLAALCLRRSAASPSSIRGSREGSGRPPWRGARRPGVGRSGPPRAGVSAGMGLPRSVSTDPTRRQAASLFSRSRSNICHQSSHAGCAIFSKSVTDFSDMGSQGAPKLPGRRPRRRHTASRPCGGTCDLCGSWMSDRVF
jgi:hypothetical protein